MSDKHFVDSFSVISFDIFKQVLLSYYGLTFVYIYLHILILVIHAMSMFVLLLMINPPTPTLRQHTQKHEFQIYLLIREGWHLMHIHKGGREWQ